MTWESVVEDTGGVGGGGAGYGCYDLMAWSSERIEIFNREKSRHGGEAAVENQLWLCVRGGRNSSLHLH